MFPKNLVQVHGDSGGNLGGLLAIMGQETTREVEALQERGYRVDDIILVMVPEEESDEPTDFSVAMIDRATCDDR